MNEFKKQDNLSSVQGIVTSNKPQDSFLGKLVPSKSFGLLLVGIVIVAAVAFGALALYGHSKKAGTDQFQQIATHPTVTVSSKADELVQKGDYAGAQKLLDEERAKATNTQDKVASYLDQASIALNAGNYVDAQTYAVAANKLAPTANTTALLGYIAAQTGDKAAAKLYYQKAINMLDKKANDYNTSLNDYQAKLGELQ